MSETEVRDYLERMTETLAVGPAPVGEVRETARRRLARRRWQVGAGALTVAVLMAATLAMPQLVGRSSGPGATPALPPDPGPGMRWVGRGRAVVAVPDSWVLLTDPCPSAERSYVYMWTRETLAARCMAAPQGLGVTVGLGSFRTASELDMTTGLKETNPVDGVRVLAGGGVWFQSDPGLQTTTFAVPSEDAYFSLSVRSHTDRSAELERIRESLTILPRGYVIEEIDQIRTAP